MIQANALTGLEMPGVAAIMRLAAPLLVAFALVVGGCTMTETEQRTASGAGIGAVVGTLLGFGGAFGVTAVMRRQLDAPVYAAFSAWFVLGERPGWYHAVGAALILPSIWLATRR